MNLDAIHEGSSEKHPVMAASSMVSVQFDPLELLPHPFLGLKAVIANELVSGGSWLSPLDAKFMGDEERLDSPMVESTDQSDICDGIDIVREFS